MDSKGYKRFAATEAEIEEKRLKLNAERRVLCCQLYSDFSASVV
jgi:hypothetical protein